MKKYNLRFQRTITSEMIVEIDATSSDHATELANAIIQLDRMNYDTPIGPTRRERWVCVAADTKLAEVAKCHE